MLKPNETCFRRKQITIISEKNVATSKSIYKKYILRKISLKFQNSKTNISCKVAFYIFFVIDWNSLEFRGQ